MALTFEELIKVAPSLGFPVIRTTLMITQEDGRSGYALGEGHSVVIGPNQISGPMVTEFSDRTRKAIPDPGGVGPYDQYFDQRSASLDPVDYTFVKTAPGQFLLKQVLKRWGNAKVDVAMTKAPTAKIYVGYGDTIGFGTGQALYAFSINSAEPGIG